MDWDLRRGRWQEVLADVEHVDAVIVDAPYSARTHGGHDRQVRRCVAEGDRLGMRELAYTALGEQDVRAFVEAWSPRCRGWFVTITDHVLAPVWAAALEDAGRYVFAPLPWVAPGSRVRLAGDGPSCWTCWIVVARPRTREFATWGTLPGAYVINADRGAHIGGKPIALMEALVRDYTRPGDLVCDPCAGYGTTLAAAVRNGRRAVGAELDPETHAQALAYLDRYGRVVDLFAAAPRPVYGGEQLEIGEGER
jgi:site-specific DNA-methyltransferase (adenine-specific)